MIHNISISMADYFKRKNIIDEDDHESLVYGFEIIISSTTGISLVIFLSLVYGNVTGGLLFLLAYCSIRSQAGGYHASSHAKCIGFFSLSFLFFCSIMKTYQFGWHPIYYIVLILIVFIIGYLAPGDTEYRIFPVEVRSSMRRNAFGLTILFSVVFLLYKNYNFINAIYLFWGEVWCACLLVLGVVKTRGVKKIRGRKNMKKVKQLLRTVAEVGCKFVLSVTVLNIVKIPWCTFTFYQPEIPSKYKEKYGQGKK